MEDRQDDRNGERKNRVEVRWNQPEEIMTEKKGADERKVLRVAIYCRISKRSDEEMEMDSLELQQHHFMKLIKDTPGQELGGVYSDNGISGTNRKRRTGFERMIRHCEEGRIDRILCKNVSRFGRNTAEVLDVVYRLKEKNIGILFEKEHIDTLTMEGDFILSTMAAIAQNESRERSENKIGSDQKRFQQGKIKFVRILGYDIERINGERKITINEKEACIVREIFEMRAKGFTMAEITRTMTEKGYKKKKGDDRWNRSSVKWILKNDRYTGEILSRKTYCPDYLTHKQRINKGEKQQYLIENHHPAIISHELFQQVQKTLELNAKAPKKNRKKVRCLDG